ncbi:TPA: lpg2461 family Dot/Icm T4SS effector [Legionella pneumophila]|uniref:lpg2461 family Dot/Icm T4SS effector n=1 Tax=Legionella pneumophila TaxID=446 RepID=UPI0009B47F6A|nr:lpg2461 family Dot/Icm T4SS effector [Legionella pneumophila]HAT8833561.1 lpg2461 family Dot/Icm T4SS effector [Legionella pneumophila subsp. pneumophila]HAT4458470.1 lpg2461 family Dot/Icm T4SS effector [Legionella pneumophila]HAT4474172.1 lpg2461 family Dot/Icm T4SS effector [Legionella pneumophila]HAT9645294.1 lpg2461 family Dot/Icm T4SS effector [Legionella pneumophila subsp. pneumophila]HAU1589188.1 lpg2461 family Dot/Icm T4SS effector [Legionella pneumophila]
MDNRRKGMSQFNFFEKNQAFDEKNFEQKLQDAIKLIKQNQSFVARLVLDAINSNQVTLSTFFQLTPNHYQKTKTIMRKDYHTTLPNTFPPTISAVRKIEKELDGIIYDNQHIYISSTKSVEEIAKTLIHEVCHFLNSDLYDKEMETEESKQVGYKDEVRAFTAEKMFEKNKGYLLRSDINQIHETVTELYPEFTDPENPISGYIYSTFDSPS